MSGTYSCAQMREYLNRKYTKAGENTRAHPHAGLTYGEGQDLLTFLQGVWNMDDMTDEQREVLPSDVKDTKLYNRIQQSQSTEMLTEAVYQQNQSLIDNVVGLPNTDRTDFSGVHTLKELQRKIIGSGVFSAYIVAEMGAGKTDFAGLLSEVVELVHGKENLRVASNVESFSMTDMYSNQFEDILQFVREGHDDDDTNTQRLVVLDEASQYLDHLEHPLEASALGKMMRLSRKAGVSLIVIGHSPKDIAPKVRNLVTYIVEKQSKKRAAFHRDMKGSGEFVDTEFELSSIPPTAVDFDTKEVSTLYFPPKEELQELVESKDVDGVSLPNEQEIAQQALDEIVHEIYANKEGLSYADIGSMIGKSKVGVRDMIKRHESRESEE